MQVTRTRRGKLKLKRHVASLPLEKYTFSSISISQTNGIFEFQIKNAQNETATWTIDLKKKGEIKKGPGLPELKPDVTIILSDDTFVDLATGKVSQ